MLIKIFLDDMVHVIIQAVNEPSGALDSHQSCSDSCLFNEHDLLQDLQLKNKARLFLIEYFCFTQEGSLRLLPDFIKEQNNILLILWRAGSTLP